MRASSRSRGRGRGRGWGVLATDAPPSTRPSRQAAIARSCKLAASGRRKGGRAHRGRRAAHAREQVAVESDTSVRVTQTEPSQLLRDQRFEAAHSGGALRRERGTAPHGRRAQLCVPRGAAAGLRAGGSVCSRRSRGESPLRELDGSPLHESALGLRTTFLRVVCSQVSCSSRNARASACSTSTRPAQVASVLDGVSAAVLAYGARGSGKTFTMFGSEFTGACMMRLRDQRAGTNQCGAGPNRGLVPRAAELLLSALAARCPPRGSHCRCVCRARDAVWTREERTWRALRCECRTLPSTARHSATAWLPATRRRRVYARPQRQACTCWALWRNR